MAILVGLPGIRLRCRKVKSDRTGCDCGSRVGCRNRRMVRKAFIPGALVDRYGPVARDLQVSRTDKCNLRCAYCMPPEGIDWLPSEAVLTNDGVG